MSQQAEGIQFPAVAFAPVGGLQMVTHTTVNINEEIRKMVQLIFSTVDTRFSYFMDSDSADKFADDIRLHSRQARSGIDVVTRLPDRGNGSRQTPSS
ncbi:MAG: hypothetical protein ACRD5H_04850 [Nitrososphaerales archaeon]